MDFQNNNGSQNDGGYQYGQSNNRFWQDANAYRDGMNPNETMGAGSSHQSGNTEAAGNVFQDSSAQSASGSAYQNAGTAGNAYQSGNTGFSGNAYQSSGTAGSAGAGGYAYQSGATGAGGSAYQSSGSTGPAYQNGGNAGQAGNMYQNVYGAGTESMAGADAGKKKTAKKKEKKERKAGGFGIKLARCAALGLVFGLVSGSVITGINYASGRLIITENNGNISGSAGNALTTSDGSIKPTSTSEKFVANGVSDIVEAVMPSLVAITNISVSEYQSFWGGSQSYESTSCGSGIIVSQNEDSLYIATNNHVVNNARTLTVTFADGATVSAEVKGTDPSTDLAVVRVDKASIEETTMNSIKVATLGNSDELRMGDAVIAIGNALGYGQSVTGGYISALNREVSVSDSGSNTSYTAELIQTDAAINPGNSGGALLNAAGEVIGINSVKYSSTEVEGIGYAIPINMASRIIEDLVTKEKVDKAESAYLGISGVDVTNDVSSVYHIPKGICVTVVQENSAAEQAGIFQGDIITKFDGREVTTMEALSSIMEYYAAGTTVDVTIARASNGQYEEIVLPVTLGRKN